MTLKKGSFAAGLQDMATRGIKGTNVRLTKKRARILRNLINEHRHEISVRYEKEGDEDDFCAAMQWLANQIDKRWSVFELVDDTRKKKGKTKL